jgi:uncharacterized protein (DUF2235 family)
MAKNIVVCFDGTSNEYDKNNTNVVRTFEAIERDDAQVAFYDPGVGTFSFLGRRLGRRFGIVMGLAFGYGIRQNIEDGYRYLMDTFEPGDRVYLFGFSRGAYTARALAGMIYRLGILRQGSENLIPYVSKLYFRGDGSKALWKAPWRFLKKILKKGQNRVQEEVDPVAAGFKATFSVPCEPQCLGVWDTVGSLGPMLSKRFPDFKLNPDIKHAFQAIAVDERRWTFQVIPFDVSDKPDSQVVEQVWFTGAHSNVGGGCAKRERALSDIAFAWMMDKASGCGLRLEDDWTSRLGQCALGQSHYSWKYWMMYLWPIRREMPQQASVHKSVIDRMEGKDDYRPALPKDHSVVVTDSYRSAGGTQD